MNHHHEDLRHQHPQVSRLVVAPCAGDETLGCGGMLAKHADDSAVVVLTELDEQRVIHFRTAQRMLCGPRSTMLDLSQRDLGGDMDRLVGILVGLIAAHQPSQVYLPFPSNQDRLIAYEAGMRSTRPPLAHDAKRTASVLLYDLEAAEVEDYPADVSWNVHESLDEGDVDRKVAAAIAYRSPLAHGLRRGAAAVGSAAGVPWAEQFALVRAPRGIEDHQPGDAGPEALAMAGSLR